jgi:hypothetical protein
MGDLKAVKEQHGAPAAGEGGRDAQQERLAALLSLDDVQVRACKCDS